MNQTLLEDWNRHVAFDDVVYHLGDFTLSGRKRAAYYFSRLNGAIKILGTYWHHDKKWMPRGSTSFHGVEILPPLYVLKHNPPITLCHYPMARWERSHYGGWHLHAHSHGKHIPTGKMMDIGVDANDYTPVSLLQVKAKLDMQYIAGYDKV